LIRRLLKQFKALRKNNELIIKGMKLYKSKFYRVLALVLFVGVLFFGVVNQVGATTATFAQDTTVALDVGNIVIEDGSVANEVTATNLTISISLISGQKIILTSTGKLHLSNNGGYGFTCEATESRLTIDATSTETVVITPSSTSCDSTGSVSSGGSSASSSGGGGGGGATTTPTTTSTPTPTPTASPAVLATPTPVIPSTSKPTPASQGFVSLSAVNLKDGDVVSAAGSSDPDIYIVNPHGYKRLFLNPVIFGFYGHLGGFSKVKGTTSTVRDTFVTSGLFRNCETNDPKVYGVDVTGEDTGVLHWVNTSGAQAVADDSNFFKKVFCINTKEFSWYSQGAAYTSVNQVPDYSRKNVASSPVSILKKYKVVDTDQLNVRALASTSSAILGKLPAGSIIESLSQSGLWHKIKYQTKDGWVHSDYLKAN